MTVCVSSPATVNQQHYMNPAATVTPQGYSDGYLMSFTGLGHFAPRSYCLIGVRVILLTDKQINQCQLSHNLVF